MTTHLGLQRILLPSAQVSELTTGSITLPSRGTQALGSLESVIITSTSTPYLHGYQWRDASGFGTKYSDPVSLIGSGAYGVEINNANTDIAVGIDSEPRLGAYQFDKTTGFGTRYSNPPAGWGGGSGINVNWHQSGSAVFAISQAASSNPNAYAFTSGTGFGSLYARNYGTVSGGFGGHFDQVNGMYILGSTGRTYYFTVAGGYGNSTAASLANAASSGGVRTSPDGQWLAINHGANPGFDIYNFGGGSYGSRLTTNIPTTQQQSSAFAFNKNSNAIVSQTNGVSSGTEYLAAIPFSGAGFGTKYTAPAQTISTSVLNVYGNGPTFSKSGDAYITHSSSSPYIHAWYWSDSTGLGTKYASPATLPTGGNNQASFTK
jgi:hypothetical protein